MHIIGTGLTGLIGTRLTELLNDSYSFEYLNSKNGVNILDKDKLFDFISASKAEVVLHMAAKTNVDGCELDKKKDEEILKITDINKREEAWRMEQTAYAVNVFGTQNIVDACKKNNKKIIYISTDFVFDGTKKHYLEEDKVNPINWYAKTKCEGEKIILQSGLEYLILRPAYPYRSFFERSDFVRSIVEKLKNQESLKMVTDHVMVPTFIDDLVNALDVLIQKNETGIFHVVGSQSVTPFEAGIKIAEVFGLDKKLITGISRRDYFKGKAPRPFCLKLKNDKIVKLGIEMSGFDKGLREVKNQLDKLNL
jgi:dTDP-4-dehydrorhamnose reductase